MSGYSCRRKDWNWLVCPTGSDTDHGITGVRFNDGHSIMFVDMSQSLIDAYLKEGGLQRDKDGRIRRMVTR